MKICPKLASSVIVVFATLTAGITNANSDQETSIPYQCQKLFKQTENLVAEAEKQLGTHTQLARIKNKLKQSKQQILAMAVEVQIKSCDLGLAKLQTKRQ